MISGTRPRRLPGRPNPVRSSPVASAASPIDDPTLPAPAFAVDGDLVARVRRLLEDGPGVGGWSLAVVAEAVHRAEPLLPDGDLDRVARRVRSELLGLGPVEDLLNDTSVSDVLINGPGSVWVEREGVLERTGVVLDQAWVNRIVDRALGPSGLRADRATPIADGRLDDRTRICVVVAPIAVDGPLVALRRFSVRPVALSAFGPDATVALVKACVARRLNMVVFGGTGAGKTTLLNAVASCLPPGERVVTIEDTAELRLPGDHVVALEAREANSEGVGEVSIGRLVRAALRLRPDRLVVGEVRGAEALDMLSALTTGHDGSLSTLHAGTPDEALDRLETLALAGGSGLGAEGIRRRVRAAVDVLVGVGRTTRGERRITGVWEVLARVEEGTVRPLISPDGGTVAPQRSRSPGSLAGTPDGGVR